MRACVYLSNSAKRDAHTLPMRLSHALIPADKSGKRDRLRRGERSIPTGAMFYARDFLAEFSFVGSWRPDGERAALPCRVLAFAQPGEVLSANRTLQAPLLGQLALPFAMSLLVAAPVVLPLRGKLPRVVGLCLSR